MKKNIVSLIITLSILLFSILYIAKSKEIVKNIDPLMDKINKNIEKYEVTPTDAIIKDNTIIPGIKGKTVDKKITYSKMKKYGTYNESLTTIKKVKPKISIDDYYDKYIISGNKNLKKVSFIFFITDLDNLEIITNYLDKEHIPATLLIDTELLENNEEVISKLSNYELELHFKNISDINISQYSNYLNSITNTKNKYCIVKEKNDKLLNICQKHKMHTVIPNIYLYNSPTVNIKKKLSNGSIILVEMNSCIKKELDYIIYYIESRGYTIARLDKLLVE